MFGGKIEEFGNPDLLLDSCILVALFRVLGSGHLILELDAISSMT